MKFVALIFGALFINGISAQDVGVADSTVPAVNPAGQGVKFGKKLTHHDEDKEENGKGGHGHGPRNGGNDGVAKKGNGDGAWGKAGSGAKPTVGQAGSGNWGGKNGGKGRWNKPEGASKGRKPEGHGKKNDASTVSTTEGSAGTSADTPVTGGN